MRKHNKYLTKLASVISSVAEAAEAHKKYAALEKIARTLEIVKVWQHYIQETWDWCYRKF